MTPINFCLGLLTISMVTTLLAGNNYQVRLLSFLLSGSMWIGVFIWEYKMERISREKA